MNPNSDRTIENLHLQLYVDSNNNNSYDIDIENDPAVELPIRHKIILFLIIFYIYIYINYYINSVFISLSPKILMKKS